MGLKDLFKSDKERQRELEKNRRRAFREADNALDSVKDRGRKLQAERDKQWAQAREYLKSGQKAAAQRCVQSVRSNELLLHKLQQKEWVFGNLLTKLDLAKSDQEFADSLKAITAVVNIDPEKVDDVLAEVEDKLGEQGATDKIWERMHSKEMEGVEECFICYSVLHQSDKSLPSMQCKNCKNKFHVSCIRKWFNTSNKSNCPLCQTFFFQ